MSVVDECDHTRGFGKHRSSAITVCRNCRDYICSICGVTRDWHEQLYVTNPPLQWRYCAKPACVEVEATYHALTVDEMTRCRQELRAKRMAESLRDRTPVDMAKVKEGVIANGGSWTGGNGKPEMIKLGPFTFKLDRGEACWCNLGKSCTGSHEIFIGEPVNVCGFCGEEFELSDTDPHFASGRGPTCPKPKQTASAS